MNNIKLDGTFAGVKSAFETMGFTCTIVTEDTTFDAYYAKDTNNKMHLRVDFSSGLVNLITSTGQNRTSVQFSFSNSGTIYYETVGDSIVFGPYSSGPSMQIAIIAPTSNDDDWQYYFYNSSSWRIWNGRTENSCIALLTKLATKANVFQVVKMFDGVRFMDNIYIMIIGPTVPQTTNNFIYVTIGEDRYFIVNIWDSYDTRTCMALKYPKTN
jgi:hypothetical protein